MLDKCESSTRGCEEKKKFFEGAYECRYRLSTGTNEDLVYLEEFQFDLYDRDPYKDIQNLS